MKKISVILIGCITPLLLACWADVPLEKIVKQNDLVVVGKIIKLTPEKPDKSGSQTNIASIKISKILKNKSGNTLKINDVIKLRTPSKLQSSKDIVYTLHTKGIWILEMKNGIYFATYPKDFQPLNKEKEIMKIIKNNHS